MQLISIDNDLEEVILH